MVVKHNTGIQWTHPPGYRGETWNPVAAYNIETGERGWHCEPAGPGCANCYAWQINETRPFAFGTGLRYNRASRDMVRLELVNLEKPLSWRMPRCVFVNSMFDLFQPAIPDEMIAEIFTVMEQADQHIFIVLTKYHERMYEWVMSWWRQHADLPFVCGDAYAPAARGVPAHIWLGVTAENQEWANKRIVMLGLLPLAGVRVVSYEPALGPLNFWEAGLVTYNRVPARDWWVLVGGESGPKARRFALEWAMGAIEQGREAGIPIFVKQMGDNPTLDGMPVCSMGRMGKDPDKWPTEFRVREFPKAINELS